MREYTEKHYLPAAEAYGARAANGGQLGTDLIQWQRGLARHWSRVRFGSLTTEQHSDHHVFQVQVYFNSLILRQCG